MREPMLKQVIFIDPPYQAYYKNQIFSDDPVLNRDNTLVTNRRLKQWLEGRHIS
mgnify:FL=1